MEKIYAPIRLGLLCALTMVSFNCKKENTDPVSPTLDYSTFTDVRDGKAYKSIKIGTQEWMAENLDFKTTFGSWCYGNSEQMGNKYGRLYTWESAKAAVPAGWHLPTDAEWKQLELSLGMSQIEADKTDGRGTNEGDRLRSVGGWANEGNGTNEVGFTALPGGWRTNSGDNYIESWSGYWWTATENSPSDAWFRFISTSNPKVYRKYGYKSDAYSVRCVKN